MHTYPGKQGRPRRYDLRPQPELANPEIAINAAALDELRERVVDQINDLPQHALTFRPEGTTLSIGALLLHLIWAEVGWIQRITGCEVPALLTELIAPAGAAVPAGELPPVTTQTADDLVMLCRQLRDEITVPALQTLSDPGAVIQGTSHLMTPRGVLYHLIWHWTYHSAHIGLLREMWGSDYKWTFGSLGITDHT